MIQPQEGTKYWYMRQHGRILNTVRRVKEETHKRSYSIWFHLCEMSRISKFTETENRLAVVRDRGRRKWGVTAWWAQGFLLGWWSFGTRYHTVVQQWNFGTRYWCHWIVRFKIVSFMLCEFHFREKTHLTLDFHETMGENKEEMYRYQIPPRVVFFFLICHFIRVIITFWIRYFANSVMVKQF